MPEINRSRDVIVFRKGDTFPVRVSSTMVSGGWSGGQGVQWTNASQDEFVVSYSTGLNHGFLLWGSDEDSDRYTATTLNQPVYQFAVMGYGGWILSTRTFEKYTLASRITPPLVPITYQPEDEVYFSLRGMFTKEDEWTISGDPRAPNTNVVGVVIQSPDLVTNNYLTLQVRL
jgi:hypothetical protein